MKIGLAVKKLREEKGISKRKLSELTQIDRSNIIRIENGQYDNLTLKTLETIASSLGVKVSEIIAEAENNYDKNMDK